MEKTPNCSSSSTTFWSRWTCRPIRRSDVVTVALAGNLGKPRPAIVIQADLFDMTSSVVILPITSLIVDADRFRYRLEPSAENGLRFSSQVMLDKITQLPREKVGSVIGRLDRATMQAISQNLALFLGLV